MKHETHATIDPDQVPAPAFGLAEDLPRMETAAHRHGRPQLLYCIEGAMRLVTASQVAVLPPARAAWLPAGLDHRVYTSRPVRLRTVYFSAADDVGGDVVVFEAPGLLAEMAKQAAAWGPTPPDRPEVAPFFLAFLGLIQGWRAASTLPALPAARTEGLGVALAWLLERLDRPVSALDAARVAGLSERTLQRRCREELGVGLHQWLVRARVLRAMELLADPELSVGEVGVRCGYETGSSFIRVFQGETGQTPGDWRRG